MSGFMVKISEDPSKREEIAALRKVAERWPKDSYLASLFTEDFITWVAMQISADWPPNMMGELQHQTSLKHDYRTEANALEAKAKERSAFFAAEVERIGAEAQHKINAVEKAFHKYERSLGIG